MSQLPMRLHLPCNYYCYSFIKFVYECVAMGKLKKETAIINLRA